MYELTLIQTIKMLLYIYIHQNKIQIFTQVKQYVLHTLVLQNVLHLFVDCFFGLL